MADFIDDKIAFPRLLKNFEAITDRFSTLTDSYRLLVGAAEELTRTPSVSGKIIDDAIERTAFLGAILDELLILIQISLLINLLDDDVKPNPFI
ncbi:MAG: hypothetical protein PWR10_1580 [Halanaerobiales bacterium]|nr:hypothetical protein [Halanaerobiales bacterium]